MTNFVQTDHGLIQLSHSDLAGTASATQFAGTATNGYVLQLVSGVPTWSSVSATNATNISGGATNSIPYQTAAGTTGFIAAGTNNYILSSVSGVPTWTAPVAGTSITGTANQITASGSTGAVTLSLPANVSIPTSTGVGLTLNTSNTTFSATSSANSPLNISNSSSTGQTSIDFVTNGAMSGRLRSDYAGNLSHVAYLSGNHAFFVGGDSGVGTNALTVSSTGISTPGSIAFNGGTLSTASSYGSFAVNSSTGAYAGIQFSSTTNTRTFMVHNTSTISGMYNVGSSAWDWYWTGGTLTLGTIPAANVSGTVASATNATNASNITVTDGYTGTMYPVGTTVGGSPGALQMYSSKFSMNGSNGIMTATGGFTVSSDRNKKDNIRVIVNAEEVVQSIRGVRFDWKDTKLSSVGVIAQEVEVLMPELVETADDGSKSVNYNGLIGVLIEAVKALQIEVNALKAR